ncbi:MAG TPA: thioesterase family protein, partial [Mycobacterium sp.]|nr:thioesterase family protein [Mycobacterium sp.]
LALLSLLLLPLIGVALDGQDVRTFLEFPPLTVHRTPAAVSWPAVTALAVIEIAFYAPVVAVMAPEPPDGLEAIGPGHPMAEINHLAAGCDIRPDLASVWTHEPGRSPVPRVWVRPRDEPTDPLFALLAGDISMPVTFAVGRTGWAPTVQMTAYLRGLPADGWLRVICTTTQIGQTWFDADHTVVDSAGTVVVQTRQLAMVPTP